MRKKKLLSLLLTQDALGNYACSDQAVFDCPGGEIITSVY